MCEDEMRIDVEMERLRQPIVALVGRQDMGCASGSCGRTVNDKVGECDEGYTRENYLSLGGS